MGASSKAINKVVKDPYFIARLKEEQSKLTSSIVDKISTSESTKAVLEQAKGMLVSYALDAVAKIKYLSDCGEAKERIQLEAAQAILDRAGLPKKEVIEHVSRNYTPEEIESAHKTLLEIESITARVSTTQSRFIIHNPEPDKDPDADREVLPTSNTRPEALPT